MTKDELADVKFKEIAPAGVAVRGDSVYNMFSLDEIVLFDTEKAVIKPGAAEALQRVTDSIGQRYAARRVRVMGFADSRGEKGYNKTLSEQRAKAVKNHLVSTGKLEASCVSGEPMGEAMPVASNEFTTGRKGNRRVEIVVRIR